ncbi:MAG TPA: hypothetical protein VMU07_04110 [Candidatus Paceibacterota bacterium]|nr:hypothetical protein [Candidatus Paceibacterota bacterium]
MDEAQAGQPKKMSLIVGILGLVTCVIMDILSLIPGVGDIEGVPGGMVFILSIIFKAGTVIVITDAVVTLLKLIPVVQEFPLWTLAWCFAWFAYNHPNRFTRRIEQAAEIAGVLEGNEEGIEELENVGSSAATTETALETEQLTQENLEVAGGAGEGAGASEGRGGSGAQTEEAGGEVAEGEEKEKEPEDISLTESEREPESVMQERLFENTPTDDYPQDEEEEEEEDGEDENNDTRQSNQKAA